MSYSWKVRALCCAGLCVGAGLRAQEGSGIRVRGMPEHAQVTVNGYPCAIPEEMVLTPGECEVTVCAFGYTKKTLQVVVEEGSFTVVDGRLDTARLELTDVTAQRAHFNPRDPAGLNTEYVTFRVTKSAKCTVTVKNAEGKVVCEEPVESTGTWEHTYQWSGRDRETHEPLPNGRYELYVRAADGKDTREVQVDTYIEYIGAYPFVTSYTGAGSDGLVFSPQILPAGVFLVQLHGGYSTQAGVVSGSLLYSPVELVELGLNVGGIFGSKQSEDISVSAKIALEGNVTSDPAMGQLYASALCLYRIVHNNDSSGANKCFMRKGLTFATTCAYGIKGFTVALSGELGASSETGIKKPGFSTDVGLSLKYQNKICSIATYSKCGTTVGNGSSSSGGNGGPDSVTGVSVHCVLPASLVLGLENNYAFSGTKWEGWELRASIGYVINTKLRVGRP
ncbi:hypothetical outer membrane protein [Treponema paraluiscuniculi Cuniculi A]|uniref:Outer membrane protein n=3 Tax=Treponema paraluiscuniculi TaxID=53435 RepID=A0ABY9E3M1_9SPIR|nr:FlgD immunoglobulin-like domain containing protein [Treponema paraluiscuniculi]AEH40848.1 hypothetical outer membrane protein [Treponema paraluiscuniculi Cuniculi A]WKC72777.1 putative outer membrane protein [Treponema paraluiscuniculi]